MCCARTCAGVARRCPSPPSGPRTAPIQTDPAYNWGPFDEMLKRAADANIKVLATIVGTPRWANGGKPRYFPPKNFTDLRKFATAAAKRYSGDYTPPGRRGSAAGDSPLARMERAEQPRLHPSAVEEAGQAVRGRQPGIYAKICNAVFAGIHSTRIGGEKVACGATAPRGNNRARGTRPSVSPLVFLTALKKAHARFDVYAHHPYYSSPSETPSTPPKASTSVTLGNIKTLLAVLQKLYPGKHLWITEYGYQTKPPDRIFGVSYAKQARYLAQAVAIVRKNPKIDMLVWFLMRDDRRVLAGWQSGFMAVGGGRRSPRLPPSVAWRDIVSLRGSRVD